MNRIVDISESGGRLRLEHRQLVVERLEAPRACVPVDETSVLILSNPAILVSQPLLSALMEAGAAVVICDGRSLPNGLMLSTTAHYAQAGRVASQAAAGLPLKKRLWQQIVKEKVRAQAELLEEVHGADFGLQGLVGQVRSGDPKNVEAQAARRYWPALFGDPRFRRRRDAEDQNRLLNYGYAVLRGMTGRAICAAGLHPSLGLHHHNRLNPFCLADDLMEPYRVLVDAAVIDHIGRAGEDAPLDRPAKTALIEALQARLPNGSEARTVFDLLARLAGSLAGILEGKERRLAYPDAYAYVTEETLS